MPPPTDRFLTTAVRGIASERGWQLDETGGGWIMRLRSPRGQTVVTGYRFDVNPAGADALANDKAGAAAMLGADGVPAVPHTLILPPRWSGWTAQGDLPETVDQLIAAWGLPVVVKKNQGSGGRSVRRCDQLASVMWELQKILAHSGAAAVAPWRSIDRELRCVVFDDRVALAYAKEPPCLVGDGVRSVAQLHAAVGGEGGVGSGSASRVIAERGHEIPAAGDRIPLEWRHNVSLGASVRPLALCEVPAAEADLARRAARSLGLRLCSVDVVRSPGGSEVLEVNAGVMLEGFSRSGDTAAASARALYGEVLDAVLG